MITKNLEAPVKCLFLDIGEVLLTNGWDHVSRKLAAQTFGLDHAEFELRHQLNFSTLEEGKLSLNEYLKRVVFYDPCPFTAIEFKAFMFEQSKPYPEMITLVRRLKLKYGLKIVVVSNEGHELNAYRIQQFKLNEIVDAFVCSCCVKLRKPDIDIYQLALDIAQIPQRRVVFIDNTKLFVEIAEQIGLHGILHVNCADTKRQLACYGLQINEYDP